MGWNIYPLGNATTLQELADLVVPKLEELGYSATFAASSSSKYGTLNVTISGVTYSGYLSDSNLDKAAAFLCVNSETNAIVVCKYNTGRPLNSDEDLSTTVNFALLNGTNAIIGETGLFVVKYTAVPCENTTNVWSPDDSGDVMLLHRALFKKNASYTAIPFVSDLFWGSMHFAPGTNITVGGETFVCLNHALFAKL